MHILIADDESIIRLGLKTMLQEMGHMVLAARNGREALQMARSHQPDMAILDIKMPYTNGLQAAKTLMRTQPMPILLLTAFSDKDLIEEASDLHIHGYLVKPIQPNELEAAIAVANKRFQEMASLAHNNVKLKETLEMRKLVDRAKGKLMESGLTEEEAYHQIQRLARERRQDMRQVAQAIIDNRQLD